MKKNAFTLAEVLITLSIIGVVAALTLPSLNLSVQNSKVGPSLRKFINTISNANEMILSENQSNTLRSVFDAGNGDNIDVEAATEAYIAALSRQIRGAVTGNTIGNLQNPHTIKQFGGQNLAQISISGVGNRLNNQNQQVNINNFRTFNFDSGESMALYLRNFRQLANPVGGHRGVFADVIYDIDGFNSGSNMMGIDVYMFRIDNNGSVIPVGGSTEASSGYVLEVARTAIRGGKKGYYVAVDAYKPVLTPQWQTGDRCMEGNVGTGINCAGSVADNNWKVTYQNTRRNNRPVAEEAQCLR